MRCALLALLFLTSGMLSAQVNPDYDPDYDGNGCYTVLDILSFLVTLMPDDVVLDPPNPNYDPDFDGNGALTVSDLTAMLTLFGNCGSALPCEAPTMDGYTYDVVQIGGVCWFAENLRTTEYADGADIPSDLTTIELLDATDGATTVYGQGEFSCSHDSPDIDACDVSQSLSEYGRLYNWYAVDDARGLCPTGWHVPSFGEWRALNDFVGAQGFLGTEGVALKSTYGWTATFGGGNGTDDFGFSALPGGGELDYSSQGAGVVGFWWSSTPQGGNGARIRILRSYDSEFDESTEMKAALLSVRCLKDYPIFFGCTDPSFVEFDPSANVEDGSCSSLLGCTNPAYAEFNALAAVDDGSCTTFVGCTDPAYVEYGASADTSDGICRNLIGCTNSDFVSLDNYNYGVVTVGDQCWFSENLRTTVYGNGDLIESGLTNDEWATTSTGAVTVYGEGDILCSDESSDESVGIDVCDEEQSLAAYGRLYNGYTVDDERGLCPEGWHVPTDAEWTNLENYIASQGFSGSEGTALKSTTGWCCDGNGTDDFGMQGQPGGKRVFIPVDLTNIDFPAFYDAGGSGYWWSSSESNGVNPGFYGRRLDDSQDVYRSIYNHLNGLSVRCLRDDD